MDFNKLETWHYFALGGGGILLIGIILYFLPIGKVKMPAVMTAGFGGLISGIALGVIFMVGFGYRPFAPEPPNFGPGEQTGDQTTPTPGPGGKGKGPGGPGMPGKKGPGGGGAAQGGSPSSKMQLSSLVNALDTVVDKPVTVTLSPEDRVAIAKQLEGLGAAGEISEDDAKARLEAIHKILEKDRKAMETVGYNWSGQAKGGFGKGNFGKDPPANPFKEGPASEHLKSLMGRLKK